MNGPDSLSEAFAELRRRAGGGEARVDVALLPPLVDVRVVELPRLRPREVGEVLTRHVGRYFPGAREPRVVGWTAVPGDRASTLRVLAAAAPSPWVEAVRAGIEAAGWSPGEVVPAHAAWREAARESTRDDAPRDAAIVAECTAGTVLLAVRGGRLVGATTVPGGHRDLADRRAVELARGGTVVRLPGDAAVHAARHAGAAARAGLLALVPAPERARRRRRRHRVVATLWAAAAVLLVVAGVLELWGVRREIQAVRAERRALAGAVAEAMAARDAVDADREVIAAIDSLELERPAWSALLTGVAGHLPPEAHLSALRGRPDSVVLEGVAADAGQVFAELRQVPGVASIRAEAPIRRAMEPGGPVERFSLAARFRADQAAPEGGG